MVIRRENILTFFIDLITINTAWSFYYYFRIRSGWLVSPVEPEFLLPMLAICLYWLSVFFLFGLYRRWYAKSRLDELATIFKAATFGVLVLFFVIFFDDHGTGSPFHNRLLIVLYWFFVICFVGAGRFLLHTFQRRLLISGIGVHNTLIVGTKEKAKELCDSVHAYPALGYKIIGIVLVANDLGENRYKDVPILGTINELSHHIESNNVKDILIALDSTEHHNLLTIISLCDVHDVSLKIIPDLYDIISGQARTNQIYGFPLIEVMPELMQPWEYALKRAIDIVVSSIVLFIGLPIWLIVALAIKLNSRGPVFYTQKRVGKDGKHFHIIKFRSMYENAEEESGPVWAHKKDPRITTVGKVLRKLRLDEIPQLINVLDGKMSLVGPRPERPFFVEQLSKEIPLYTRRLKVRPGITGWAQVKHKYDESVEDVKRKVEYDLFYIENMSIRMDLKILFNTIAVVLLGKGH
jgi:exopolysaccharide biosynthesis polyprenyl glycosylphosphotransferase